MSALFSEARIGGETFPNRIVVSPMCQYSAIDGVAQSWHLIHLGSMMMTGAGLVIVEATAVEEIGRGTLGDLGLWNGGQEAALAGLVSELRKLSSAKIGIQLGHCGRKASTRTIPDRWRGEPLSAEEGAWKPVAPSAIAFDEGWQVPVELGEAEILRIIEAFAESARRALRAGFDLIEIHGAHGYLIHNFLSPITNRRTDGWGGSATKRARFAVEVVKSVRAVWPRERALGFRFNSTDWTPEGSTLDDAVALAKMLESEGLDYAVMSAGNIRPGIAIPPATPGHQVPFAQAVKRETSLAAIAVGMIQDPHQAEEIISSGAADFVALARPMLDNPRWGLHAAASLGVDVAYPPQYLRARPNNWLGYMLAHPNAQPPQSTLQLDRPRSVSAWDRPPATATSS
ncbi:MAG TPA: NADH:flavin oxidoreductase/NADH oxidase [Rhizobiaceae bacterium]|nr:NADH:flavin oxidoreductase/NADH oxidase [Rhizobiaceae bacterium]